MVLFRECLKMINDQLLLLGVGGSILFQLLFFLPLFIYLRLVLFIIVLENINETYIT